MGAGFASPQLRPLAGLGAVLVAAVVLVVGRDAMAWGPLTRAVLPLVWLAGWSLACIGAGGPIVAAILGTDDPLRRSAVVAAAAGAAALSLAATLLAAGGLLTQAALIALLTGSLLAGVAQLRRYRPREDRPWPEPASRWLLALPLLCASAITLVLTTPPVMYDVANYHLAFPEHWLAAGGFVEYPRQAFSYYPAAHGMLWTFALATVGAWGASALSAWFGVVMVIAAGALGRRLVGGSAATWAVVCLVATPAVLEVAAYAAADLVVAAWAAVALLVVVGSDGRPRRAVLAGFLVGSAIAAKYLAIATVALPLAAAIAVVAARRGRRASMLAVATLAIAAAVPVLPWFVRNALWTGNPLYPYFRELLGGPPSGLSIATDLRQNGVGTEGWLMTVIEAVAAPVRRSFHPLGQGGWIGLQWLILLPTAAMTQVRRSRDLAAVWVATASGFLAWGALVQFGRFALPALAFSAPLAGVGAAAFTGTGSRPRRVVATALLVTILAGNATVLGTRLNLDRLAVTSGRLADEEYLARWLDYAPLLPAIGELVPADGSILLIAESRSLYLPRRVLVEDPYHPPWLVQLARGGSDLRPALLALGVTHVLVNEGDMARHAALRNVADYWDGATAAERAAIDRFLGTEVAVEARAGGTWLARIRSQSTGSRNTYDLNTTNFTISQKPSTTTTATR